MTNSREIAEQAFALLRNALEESEAQRHDLEDRLQAPRPEASEIEQAYAELRAEFAEVTAERDLWKKTSGQLQDVTNNERAKAQRLTKKLGVAESGTDKAGRKEVNFWRDKAEKFEEARRSYQQRIQELKDTLQEREQQIESQADNEARVEELERLASLLEERDSRISELSAAQENSRLQLSELEGRVDEAEQWKNLNAEYRRRIAELETQHDREIAVLREEHAQFEDRLETERQTHAQQLEHRDAEQNAREQMHSSALIKARTDTAEAITAEFEPRVTALTTQLDEQSNAFAEVEANLAEERHRSDNLNEIANERRESLTKTTEKLEEMEERYEDAKWHLGKAKHFEKLVNRRRKLTTNLISTIRARQKANNSLKAGLDSLRRYKATAAERQQELLRRTEILENSLHEAREKLAQANEARRASDSKETEEKAADNSEALQLRNQVAAQTDVIESLESDLKSARIAETEARTTLRESEKLHDDIATKNTFIGTLQKDIEEQQKTLAQLRKRDIEVKELRTQLEQHERRLNVLQSENAQLRNAKNGEVESIDQKKIAEQEKAIQRLTTKLKEYEATIATLSEAADSWKRKYDFLAAETPYGYESANSK